MNNDERIWQDACERMGAWKRGQQAREVCMGIQTIWVACEANHPDAQEFPCPPIDDSAAAMAMLVFAAKVGEVRVRLYPDSGDFGVKVCFDEGGYINGEHDTLSLAIAAAVVALPH